MILALANVCSLPSTLEQDVEEYAAGQCRAMEVWFTKLENYLQTHSLAECQRLFGEHEVTPVAASFQGGLLDSQGEKRRVAWDLFRRRLQFCRELKISTVIVAGDIAAPLDEQTLERVKVSLRQVAQECATHEMRAALEFQSSAAFANNLQTATALVAEIGHESLGLCLDAFHFYVGPSKTEDLGYLTPQNLFHVQLCDLADVPREFASDADRILPGEGDIPIGSIVAALQQLKYAGAVSVELMNPQLWQVPPRQFGEIALTSLRKALGYATMGK
jgi:sugar phosphate isomerase/epimerase